LRPPCMGPPLGPPLGPLENESGDFDSLRSVTHPPVAAAAAAAEDGG
jgi:hypothetical protein